MPVRYEKKGEIPPYAEIIRWPWAKRPEEVEEMLWPRIPAPEITPERLEEMERVISSLELEIRDLTRRRMEIGRKITEIAEEIDRLRKELVLHPERKEEIMRRIRELEERREELEKREGKIFSQLHRRRLELLRREGEKSVTQYYRKQREIAEEAMGQMEVIIKETIAVLEGKAVEEILPAEESLNRIKEKVSQQLRFTPQQLSQSILDRCKMAVARLGLRGKERDREYWKCVRNSARARLDVVNNTIDELQSSYIRVVEEIRRKLQEAVGKPVDIVGLRNRLQGKMREISRQVSGDARELHTHRRAMEGLIKRAEERLEELGT